MVTPKTIPTILFLFLIGSGLGCDSGLAPPGEVSRGAIRGSIIYSGEWASPDSVRELRFVGMRFVPQDTSDFLQLNRMAISDTLARFVSQDSFFLSDVEEGPYVYSGVAENFGRGIIDWRPIGLYEDNEGVFIVRGNETTEIIIEVNLSARPPFPPVIDP